MKLLTQNQAQIILARVNVLSKLENLTQMQAIEAVELLDDLAYSYHKMTNSVNDPDQSIRLAANELADKRDELADEFDICTCCYQPNNNCYCGREFDDWLNEKHYS